MSFQKTALSLVGTASAGAVGFSKLKSGASVEEGRLMNKLADASSIASGVSQQELNSRKLQGELGVEQTPIVASDLKEEYGEASPQYKKLLEKATNDRIKASQNMKQAIMDKYSQDKTWRKRLKEYSTEEIAEAIQGEVRKNG